MPNKRRYEKHDLIVAFFFLLPMLIIFGVFKYVPLIDNVRISFTSWNLFSPTKKYVGFLNYKTLLTRPLFWQILGNTLFYTVWSTILSMIMGLLIAIVFTFRKSKGSKVLKTLFFLPNVTTASAVAILWMWIFDPDVGLSGQLFNLLGLQSPRWLLTPGYAKWIIISLSVWRSMGYVMLVYSSGLANISNELYEAAYIDGANTRQTTLKIVIPLLAPTTYFLLMTSFIQAMQVFDIVAVMTNGGPYNSTNVMNLYIYQTAFQSFRAGSAASLSVILFLLLLVFTIIQRLVSHKGGKEYA